MNPQFSRFAFNFVLIQMAMVLSGLDDKVDAKTRSPDPSSSSVRNFISDRELIATQTNLIELIDEGSGHSIIVTPEYQGRVLVSSLGDLSIGWLNRDAFTSGDVKGGAAVGGADRLWIGPLGGQYSFYYGQKRPLSDQNWEVPAPFNRESFEVVKQSTTSLQMEKSMQITNFVGTTFDLLVRRKIQILDCETIESHLGIETEGLAMVAFESINSIENTGSKKWERSSGIPSVWSLGMFEGTDRGVLIIPLGSKTKVQRSDIVEYLSEAGTERFSVKGNTLIYRCDGKFRNKIGIPPHLCGPVWGSYHPETGVLTVIQYQFEDPEGLFFNSDATVQKNPYMGDPIQVYNHGPMDLSEGIQNLFYEMESTSAAVELKPGDVNHHWHRVFHFEGSDRDLNQLFEQLNWAFQLDPDRENADPF